MPPKKTKARQALPRSGWHRANNKVRTVPPATVFATVGLRSAHCACALAMALASATLPLTPFACHGAGTLSLRATSACLNKNVPLTDTPAPSIPNTPTPTPCEGIAILRCYVFSRTKLSVTSPLQAATVRPAFPFRLRSVTLRCVAAPFRPCVPLRLRSIPFCDSVDSEGCLRPCVALRLRSIAFRRTFDFCRMPSAQPYVPCLWWSAAVSVRAFCLTFVECLPHSVHNKVHAVLRQEKDKQKPSLSHRRTPDHRRHSTPGSAPAGKGQTSAGHSIPLRYTPLQGNPGRNR